MAETPTLFAELKPAYMAPGAPGDVNWRALYASAVASHYVYYDKLSNKARLKAAGYHQFEWLLTKYVEGVVAFHHDHALIVLRGSSTGVDWGFNLSANPAPVVEWGDDVTVHKGFLGAYRPIHAQVLDALEDCKTPVFVVGHSLGGAKALLCAMHLASGGVDARRLHVHTFGQPRVGNQAFADRITRVLGDRYLRVVHQEDVITGLPRPMVHAGRELFFNACGVLAPKIDLYAATLAEVTEQFPALQGPLSVEVITNLREYHAKNPDTFWDDVAATLVETITKVTAPWLVFHDHVRYANVLWAHVQTLDKPQALDA